MCWAQHGIASYGANRFPWVNRLHMTERTRSALPPDSLDRLFRTARTYNAYEPEQIAQALIHEIYELAKWAPTASNCNPGRFVFLTSPEAKARLAPHMSNSNRPKTLAAPVNVIMAYDLKFFERMPPRAWRTRWPIPACGERETACARRISGRRP